MRSSSRPITMGCSGSHTGLPLRLTRPARTQAAATVREATPSFDKARATPTRRTEAGRVSVRVLRGRDMVRTVMPYPPRRIAPLKKRQPKLNHAEKRQFDQKFLRGSLEVRSHRSDMRDANAGPRPEKTPLDF